MKAYVVLTLIVLGALLILGPVAAHAYCHERDGERIAEFFARAGHGEPLPSEMRPMEYEFYDYSALVVGLGMVVVGVIGSGILGELPLPFGLRETTAMR